MYWWQFNILIGTLAEVVERQVNVRTCQAHLNRPYDRLHEIIWNTPNSLPNTNHMQNHRGPSVLERRNCAFSLNVNMPGASCYPFPERTMTEVKIVQTS